MQLIAIAAIVCLFAVGMAALLNFYKYRGTATSIVKSRLVVTGRNIENTIQSALAIGLSTGELETLPAVFEREMRSDDVIQGIHLLGVDGEFVLHAGGHTIGAADSAAWLQAARVAAGREWFVDGRDSHVVGVSIQNNFGVIVGHLAIRYSSASIDRGAARVARDIAGGAMLIFVVSAGIAVLLLGWVMRRVDADIRRMEQVLGDGTANAGAPASRSLIERSLDAFLASVRAAETQIIAARLKLRTGDKP